VFHQYGIERRHWEGYEPLVLLPNVKVCPDGGSCGIGMAVALALGLGLLDCKGVGV